jgi:hypothetical protein
VIKSAVALLALAFVVTTGTCGNAQTPRPAPPPPPSPFSIRIDAQALAGLSRITISATDEKGHTDRYNGVSLHDLLVKAGAPSGEPVRGKAMLSYVVIGAGDGYHVLFTLPELDPSYTDHVAVIAESIDGKPFADAGPYRLVVPFEKRQARWVRNVTTVSLQNASVVFFEAGQ